MNQDTHLYIEVNQKHGHGYQVHILIDGIVDTTMADEPFSLYDALGGAQLLRDNGGSSGPWLTIRGKQQPEGCITACEAICLAYAAAREDHKPKGNDVCMAFCRHLAAKRYGSNASELYNTLMRQPTTDMGYAWIRRAFQAVDIGAATIQQWFSAE